MSNTVVKGGTPVGSASLCRTCSSAQIMSGYRESELLTICTELRPNLVVPFVIHECTNYYDKNRPSWDEMRRLAIDVVRDPLKPVGFRTGAGFTTSVRLVTPPGEEDDDV